MLYAVKANGVSKERNGKKLFENVSLEVSFGERVALIGRNGIGKTSLIEGMMGQLPFDTGTVERGVPLESWGWLEQNIRAGRRLHHIREHS